MNATENNLNKQSTSVSSDSSVSTTTVALGNVELNLEPFSAIAKKLVEAGWDGDEDELEISGKKKDLQCKYGNCVFPEKDLQDIRSVVLRQL